MGKTGMISCLQIWPQALQQADNKATISAVVEGPETGRKELWFQLPSEHMISVTERADPLVLATIFPAMRSATSLRVRGSVSHSLLRNLEEFQVAWNCWRPDHYHVVDVIADGEIEEGTTTSDKAIAAFSGGLDSCFTVWRHTRGGCGRSQRNLKAAVMVHGFDIPLHEKDVFSRAAENSRAIVESVGLEFIPMACNFREFGDDWEDEHGAALAACLSLLGKGFSTGVVASSHVYNTLLFPWGSNPLTDPMLSSDSFSIVHDAAGVHRIRKARGIAEWEEAMRLLRVCWQGAHKDRNCGGCLRCIATALCFAATGVEPPACLGVPSLDEGVKRLRTLRIKPVAVIRMEEILAAARETGIQASWVSALDRCIHRKRTQNRRSSNKVRRGTIELVRRVLGHDTYFKIKGLVTR